MQRLRTNRPPRTPQRQHHHLGRTEQTQPQAVSAQSAGNVNPPLLQPVQSDFKQQPQPSSGGIVTALLGLPLAVPEQRRPAFCRSA